MFSPDGLLRIFDSVYTHCLFAIIATFSRPLAAQGVATVRFPTFPLRYHNVVTMRHTVARLSGLHIQHESDTVEGSRGRMEAMPHATRFRTVLYLSGKNFLRASRTTLPIPSLPR